MKDLVQGSKEWMDWRRQGIGASEVAAIVGVCKYSTPYKVWKEKTGVSEGFAGNFATERGSELEPKVRARYELMALEDMAPAIAEHPTFTICRASLDGISKDRKLILEIKCPSKDSHLEALAGKVPDHYKPQVQYQLAVTGADKCHYFSYYDRDPEIEMSALVEVIPDFPYQGFLFDAVLRFWELVKSKTPPPLTDNDEKEIESGEAFEICQRLMNEKATLKKSESDSLKETAIRLGGHSRIRCGKVLLTKSVTGTYRLTLSKDKL